MFAFCPPTRTLLLPVLLAACSAPGGDGPAALDAAPRGTEASDPAASARPADLLHLELELRLVDQRSPRLEGKARLLLAPGQGAVQLALARELELVGVTDSSRQPLDHLRSGDGILLSEPVEEVLLEFAGVPTAGLWFEHAPAGGALLRTGWTQLSTPAGAWFPRSIDPEDVTTARILLRLPTGWAGVASGRATPRGFRTEQPVPASRLAVSALRGGRREIRSHGNLEVQLLTAGADAGTDALAEEVLATLRRLEELTLSPPPWRTLAVVEGVPDGLPGCGHAWVQPGPGLELPVAVAEAWIRGLAQGSGEADAVADARVLARALIQPGRSETAMGAAPDQLWLARALAQQDPGPALAPAIGDWGDPSLRDAWTERLGEGVTPEQLAPWRASPDGPSLELRPAWSQPTSSGERLLLSAAQLQQVGEEGLAESFEVPFTLQLGMADGRVEERELTCDRRRQILEVLLERRPLWMDARLGVTGSVRVVQEEQELLDQARLAPEDEQRARALRGLAELVRSESIEPEEVEAPALLRKASGPLSRVAALELLSVVEGRSIQESLLRIAQEEPGPGSRAAQVTLRRLSPAGDGELAQRASWARSRMLDAELDRVQRRAAAALLAASDPEQAAELLARLLQDCDPALAHDLASILVQLPGGRVARSLEAILAGSQSPARRAAILEALLQSSSENARAVLATVDPRQVPGDRLNRMLEQRGGL